MVDLRPFQAKTLAALEPETSSERHVLCIAPTGAGKSLIYERAAATAGRRTLLITPLVALARQQFRKLEEQGIPVTLGAGEKSNSLPPSQSGVWILSPEMLQSPLRLKTLENWKPNQLVVDECHCLWDWGETFRPAFLQIPEVLKRFHIPKSLWLTATLPLQARIALRTLLPHPPIEIGGFDLPPRLKLNISRVSWTDRTEATVDWISKRKGAGIVFVSTRGDTLRLSRLLEAIGKKALPYHAGMSVEERRNSEAQIRDKIPDVIVATSAFGMGMDYPHLSYALIWQSPPSILSLVQTVGRVGRNPTIPGEVILFWDKEDFQLLEWTVKDSKKRRHELIELSDFFSSWKCRTAWLRNYFDGTQSLDNCLRCDICAS